MDPRCKGMPLSSFLLKPMQRVTRYPLIIKNVSMYSLGANKQTCHHYATLSVRFTLQNVLFIKETSLSLLNSFFPYLPIIPIYILSCLLSSSLFLVFFCGFFSFGSCNVLSNSWPILPLKVKSSCTNLLHFCISASLFMIPDPI